MVSVIYIFLIFLTFVSAFKDCPKCGSLDVPYPLSTSGNCGNPKYRIHCKNVSLEFLSAQGVYYKIININPTLLKLIIRPPSMQNPMCQCSDLSLGGLLLDENSPFNISTRNTVMLFNCSDTILLSPLNCSSNSMCRLFQEKTVEGSGCRNTLCCSFLKDASITSHRIRIRVGGCTAYTSVVELKPDTPVDSWNFGIELQWAPSLLL